MTAAKAKTLGSVISVSKGKKHLVVEAPSSSSKRLLGIDDLRNDNLLRYTDDPSGTVVLPEDVLIAWDGANAGTIGFGKSGYIGSTIARLRIHEEEKIFTPFLGMFLKSKFGYLRQTATGATIPHINRKALDDIELPDVDFDDQIRIAHLLGKVEGLIAQRKQHLQQLDELLKSVFLEMFGDPVRNEKGWTLIPLSKLLLDIESGNSPVCEARKASADEWGVLKLGAVTKCYFQENENKALPVGIEPQIRHEVKDGDLLFGRKNTYELVGACAYVFRTRKKLLMPDLIFRFVFRDDAKINPIFIWKLLTAESQRRKIQSLAAGAAGSMPNISKTSLKQAVLPIPPVALQNKFATIVAKVEDLKSRYKQSLMELETLYGALSQQAFKGELDLSRVPLPDIKHEEEKAVVTEPLQARAEEGLAIHLPDTGNELDALENTEAREALIAQWLEAYRGQLGDAAFSVERFMVAAQTRLAELHPDDDFELDANDYEHIKTWVFEALEQGRLTQIYDDTNNRVQLNAARL